MLRQYKLLTKNYIFLNITSMRKNIVNAKKIFCTSQKEKFYAALEQEVITINRPIFLSTS